MGGVEMGGVDKEKGGKGTVTASEEANGGTFRNV